jgi:hypothetical protein
MKVIKALVLGLGILTCTCGKKISSGYVVPGTTSMTNYGTYRGTQMPAQYGQPGQYGQNYGNQPYYAHYAR